MVIEKNVFIFSVSNIGGDFPKFREHWDGKQTYITGSSVNVNLNRAVFLSTLLPAGLVKVLTVALKATLPQRPCWINLRQAQC